MAIGRKDELDVEPLALGVTLGLAEAVTCGEVFFVSLDEGQGNGLGPDIDLHSQDIVDLSAGASPRLAVDDLDRASGLFTPNKVFCPAAFVYGWIDQLGSRIGLVHRHRSYQFRRITFVVSSQQFP